jgi:hypothetical protein
MSETLANQHERTPFAQVRGGKVTYHSEKPVLRKSATGVSRQQSKLQLSF